MNKNKIPQKIKWGYTTYTFRHGKGKTLCYENNPIDYYDDSYGEILIIEYRPEMSPKDRFYVLYHIVSEPHLTPDGITANTISKNLSGKPRIATPIWD